MNFVFGVTNGISLAAAPLVLIPHIGYRGTMVLGSILYSIGPLLTRYAMDQGLTIRKCNNSIWESFKSNTISVCLCPKSKYGDWRLIV